MAKFLDGTQRQLHALWPRYVQHTRETDGNRRLDARPDRLDLRAIPGSSETPAIQVRFSRFCGTVHSGPAQRQETQIVQSRMTLDDFLPRFRPQVLCRAGKARRKANSTAIGPRSNAERCFEERVSKDNMTLCNVLLTARVREHRGPARMHRRPNAAGTYSTACKGEHARQVSCRLWTYGSP